MLQQNKHKNSKGPRYAVGLDASLTSFGVYMKCLGDGEDYHFCVTSTKEKNVASDMHRVVEIADMVVDAVLSLNTLIVCFEDYGPIGRTAGKITARAEICGIVKHALYRRGIDIITVTPNALKKFATDNGQAKKDMVMDAAAKQGFFTTVSDEADAFFAANLATEILEGNTVNADFTRVRPRT